MNSNSSSSSSSSSSSKINNNNNTKEYDDHDHDDQSIGYINGKMVYQRIDSNSTIALRLAIAKLYKARNTVLFPSGMNALYNIFKFACMTIDTRKKKGFFVYCSESYSETVGKIIPFLEKEFPNIGFKPFDPHENIYSNDNILKTIDVFFCESCTNPSGRMIDWSLLLPKLSPTCYVIIDNTWLTPYVFNPFSLSKTMKIVVVESCSKYISGGQRIMGHCTFGIALDSSDPIQKYIEKIHISMGLHVADEHCNVILKNIPKIKDKMTMAYQKTLKIIVWLKQKNITFSHPSDPSNPSHQIYKKYIGDRINTIGSMCYYDVHERQK